MFKISPSEFVTVSMCRQILACTDEFLAMETDGVVHSVFTVVTRLSFGVTWQHKASGDKWTFCNCVTMFFLCRFYSLY